MIRRAWFGCVALLGICVVNGATIAFGQELLWSKLPEDGSWVRFHGTVKDLQERPDNNEGALEITWLSELTIKSVGREMAEIKGVKVPCRWIEFKKVVGYQSAEGIRPGPYGVRIHKVLVPEDKVTGKLEDETKIPVTFIPIVKGFRKVGDREVEPIREKVLVTYPTLTLLPHYKKLITEGPESEDVDLPQIGTVTARHFRGTESAETDTLRSSNVGDLWLSPDMPFGLAKYRVKLVREEKEDTDAREDFKKVAEVDVEMSAIEKGSNAQSDLDEGTIVAARPNQLAEPAKLKDSATEEPADAAEPTDGVEAAEEAEMEAADEAAEMPEEEMSADESPAEEMPEDDATPAADKEQGKDGE